MREEIFEKVFRFPHEQKVIHFGLLGFLFWKLAGYQPLLFQSLVAIEDCGCKELNDSHFLDKCHVADFGSHF